MNNLSLYVKESFNGLECDLWKNEEEDIFMTSNQLGTVLGYADPRKAISKIVGRNNYLEDNEFSGVVNLGTISGIQETRMFTEDGIYEVAMLSKTETAKQFRSWIRKVLKGLRSQELMLIKTKLLEQKEQVENYNILTNAQNNLSMLEVAKSLRLGRNKLFKFLREEEILMSAESRKNVPYQPYIDSNYFYTVMGTVINNGKAKDVVITTVTPKGIDFIVKICKKKGLLNNSLLRLDN